MIRCSGQCVLSGEFALPPRTRNFSPFVNKNTLQTVQHHTILQTPERHNNKLKVHNRIFHSKKKKNNHLVGFPFELSLPDEPKSEHCVSETVPYWIVQNNSPVHVNHSSCLEQVLTFEILVNAFVDHIATGVLVLDLLVLLEQPLSFVNLQLLVQSNGVLYRGHVLEVQRVGDLQQPHPVRVPPLLEVALEGLRPLVGGVAADLALVLHVEAVQLVQPVGDRLAVPPKWQVLWVINRFVVIVLLVLQLHGIALLVLLHDFLSGHGHLALDVEHRVCHHLAQQLAQPVHTRLLQSEGLVLLSVLLHHLAPLSTDVQSSRSLLHQLLSSLFMLGTVEMALEHSLLCKLFCAGNTK
eukprot:Colp12_sorted_trinity150504_noHs@20524